MASYPLLPHSDPHDSDPNGDHSICSTPLTSDEKRTDTLALRNVSPSPWSFAFVGRWRIGTLAFLLAFIALFIIGTVALFQGAKGMKMINDAKEAGVESNGRVKESWNGWGQDDDANAHSASFEGKYVDCPSENLIDDKDPVSTPTIFEEDVSSDTSRFATILRLPTSTETPVPIKWTNPSVEQCTNESKSLRSNPASWVYTRFSNDHFIITPRVVPPPSQLHCFRSAIFSARLISVDDTDPPSSPSIIQSLPRPSSAAEAGDVSYSVDIPSNTEMQLPTGAYHVEVVLEFGGMLGLIEGMPCGPKVESCTPENLGRMGLAQAKFIGGVVEVSGESTVYLKYSMPMDENATSPEYCTSLSPLRGHWSSHRFIPADCQLSSPLLSFPSPSLSSKLHWIHLVGDSNSRNLYKYLRDSFKFSGPMAAHALPTSPLKNNAFSAVAFRRYSEDVDIATDPALEPQLVLTWQFWTQDPALEKAEENAKNLKYWTDVSLEEYLSRAKMSSSVGSEWTNFRRTMGSLRPSRIYVSLGSHSESLTSLGVSKSLDVLLGPLGIQSLLPQYHSMSPTPLRFFTTTLVQTSLIPLRRYPHQDLIRNNAVISAKNDVLRQRKELEGIVVDTEGITKGITEESEDKEWMKDAVHFQPFVYQEWLKLIWTDLQV